MWSWPRFTSAPPQTGPQTSMETCRETSMETCSKTSKETRNQLRNQYINQLRYEKPVYEPVYEPVYKTVYKPAVKLAENQLRYRSTHRSPGHWYFPGIHNNNNSSRFELYWRLSLVTMTTTVGQTEGNCSSWLCVPPLCHHFFLFFLFVCFVSEPSCCRSQL